MSKCKECGQELPQPKFHVGELVKGWGNKEYVLCDENEPVIGIYMSWCTEHNQHRVQVGGETLWFNNCEKYVPERMANEINMYKDKIHFLEQVIRSETVIDCEHIHIKQLIERIAELEADNKHLKRSADEFAEKIKELETKPSHISNEELVIQHLLDNTNEPDHTVEPNKKVETLADKKVGDSVWSIAFDGEAAGHPVMYIEEDTLYVRFDDMEDMAIPVETDGTVAAIGNGQQLFFATKEEAEANCE